MSILDDMLQKHANGRSRLRVIEVVWAMTSPGEGASQKNSVSAA